jgi:hypothetical protein
MGQSLEGLSLAQLGLEKLDQCHHATINQTMKVGPPSFRVRICRQCCGGIRHIELGTYVDQESAILVNDVHELMAGRGYRLIVLRPEDKEHLGMLAATFCSKGGKWVTRRVLDILKEKHKN